ncbi:MAG: hypothetical protein CMJ49_07355 [Planctomycetaceae bacterium]|nr:hypothetical protein [Planctomycetaceae bacterium]
MFGFLTPWALVGLVVLSVPIVLHLFKPRKVRRTPFSSLRWLRASQHRLSRRIQWHQLLLLLLRVAFLTLLVLALAKPIFSSSARTAPTDRFVILNVGRTMGYRQPGAASHLNQGRRAAERLIAHFSPGDRTTVLLSGRRTHVVGPLVGDAAVYLPHVRAATVQPDGFDLNDALQTVRPLLDPASTNRELELSIVTDNALTAWSLSAIQRFNQDVDRPLRVNVIDISSSRPTNAWIADAHIADATLADPGPNLNNTRTIHVIVRAASDEPSRRTLTLTDLPGVPPTSAPVTVQPDGSTIARFSIPANAVRPGAVAKLQLSPNDALSDDDVFWLNLDNSAALSVLVIEPNVTQIKQLQPGHHLRTALDALSAAAPGTLRVTSLLDTDILSPAIADADVIMMVDVPRLSEGNLQALQHHVAAGAGLIVFLGPTADVAFYNRKMHNPLTPSRSLLPVEVGARLSARRSDALPALSHVDITHPIFAGLTDPKLGDLGQVRFLDYVELHPAAGAAPPRALATIGPSTPAVIDHPCGNGRVILLNTTGNDATSNLATRNIFLPLLDQMFTYLSHHARVNDYTVGDVADLPLPNDARDRRVTLTTPTGEQRQPTLRTDAVRPSVQVQSLDQPGVYTITYQTDTGDRNIPFVVRTDRRDSTLTTADEAILRQWWQPADFTITRPDRARGNIDLARSPAALDPWLIVLAFVVFLAEMYFVHRLCPKVNPTVVSHPLAAQAAGTDSGLPDPHSDHRMQEIHATTDAAQPRESSRA